VEIEDQVRVRSEAGVLDRARRERVLTELLPELESARRSAHGSDQVKACSAVLRVELLADDILTERGWRRLLIVHHAPILLYYLALVLGIAILGRGADSRATETIWSIPLAYAAVGALGACFRGLWWLSLKIMRQQYRVWFLVPYLLAPMIGAFLGAVVYLLARVGAVGNIGGSDSGPVLDAIPTLLAFLAGSSWEWALARLEALKGSR